MMSNPNSKMGNSENFWSFTTLSILLDRISNFNYSQIITYNGSILQNYMTTANKDAPAELA
jgi:hypothetical protein